MTASRTESPKAWQAITILPVGAAFQGRPEPNGGFIEDEEALR